MGRGKEGGGKFRIRPALLGVNSWLRTRGKRIKGGEFTRERRKAAVKTRRDPRQGTLYA